MLSEGKANILLVGDQPNNWLALSTILESLDQNLVRAHSGEEALRCLLQHDFAAILLDVQMPGVDGFETAALIRQRAALQHTPIIFISAVYLEESYVLRGYSLGAVDYLFKPIVPEILISKVSVFISLFQKTQELKHQVIQLAATNQKLQQEITKRQQAEKTWQRANEELVHTGASSPTIMSREHCC